MFCLAAMVVLLPREESGLDKRSEWSPHQCVAWVACRLIPLENPARERKKKEERRKWKEERRDDEEEEEKENGKKTRVRF